MRAYSLSHIKLAITVEKSGQCTQDCLDDISAKTDRNYLRNEELQERVEMARHFIFDELALLEPIKREKYLRAHLSKFTNDREVIEKELNEIMKVYSH